jgi:molecular chaperone DnaK (HSP70)
MVADFYGTNINELVISVPTEFDQMQRNYTSRTVDLAGMNVRRVISEPTAAVLAYGLHEKKGVEYILVVDIGIFSLWRGLYEHNLK